MCVCEDVRFCQNVFFRNNLILNCIQWNMQIIKFCNHICRSIFSVAQCCYRVLRTTLIFINHYTTLEYSFCGQQSCKVVKLFLYYCLLKVDNTALQRVRQALTSCSTKCVHWYLEMIHKVSLFLTCFFFLIILGY